MRKVVLIVLFMLLAFYAGWPFLSLYQIRAALEANDKQALASKVDFADVRESLRPAVTAEVTRGFDKAGGGGALGQMLGGSLKQQLVPQIVEAALKTLVTPGTIAELYSYRGEFRELIGKRVGQPKTAEGGNPGAVRTTGVGEKSTAPSASEEPQPRPRLGLANVKSFSMVHPLSFSVGVARDVNASVPDLVARFSFRNFDWKLTGLEPRAR
jgi:hypothetical protein